MFRTWFSFDAPVDRRTYFGHGLGLMLFKYGVDAGVLYYFIGKVWTPWDYFIPVWSARQCLNRRGRGCAKKRSGSRWTW